MLRELQAGAIRHWAKLIDRKLIDFWIVHDVGHLPLKCLTRMAEVREIVSVPDPCRLLEVDRLLVVCVSLGLLQIAFLDEFFY